MASFEDVGGKHWIDNGGPEHEVKQVNLNQMIPPGLAYIKPTTTDRLIIAPIRWVAGVDLLDQAEADIFVGAGTPGPATDNDPVFIYLSKIGGPASQVNITGSFPAFGTGAFFLIAIVDRTAGEIDNVQPILRPAGEGAAAVTTVGGTLPIVSSGGLNPQISINPASGALHGSLSTTDFNKLQNVPADTVTELAAKIASSLLTTNGQIIHRSGGAPAALGAGAGLMVPRSNSANNAMEFVAMSALIPSLDEIMFLQASSLNPAASTDPAAAPIPFPTIRWSVLSNKGANIIDPTNNAVMVINTKGRYLFIVSAYLDGVTGPIDWQGRNPISSGVGFGRILLNTGLNHTGARFSILDLTGVTPPYYIGVESIATGGTFPNPSAPNLYQVALVKISDN